ncbi:MAG: hypothetical protein WBQ57_00250 [Rhodanobacteraceae bacterium]
MKLPPCLVCALSLAVGATTAADAGTNCQPVFDALQKMAVTPVHEYIHRTAAFMEAPSDSEVVITGNAMYLQISGKWRSIPYDSQQRAQEIRQSAATRHTVCTRLGDESVGAEAAAVYGTHDDQGEGSTVDGMLWVSKSRGLLLRQTIDMDVGGKHGKSHTDIHFDYANVHAPAGRLAHPATPHARR